MRDRLAASFLRGKSALGGGNEIGEVTKKQNCLMHRHAIHRIDRDFNVSVFMSWNNFADST